MQNPSQMSLSRARLAAQHVEVRAQLQLRIADEADKSAVLVSHAHSMSSQVPVGQRRKIRSDGAESDRPSGKVDVVGIFRSTRIRLNPSMGPQLLELRRVKLPQQKLDRVKYRRGMWFDGDEIAMPHEMKE